jgi:hypothetical protein
VLIRVYSWFAISPFGTKNAGGVNPKIQKNKNFYPLLSQALINFDPPRHFAISNKKRRFAPMYGGGNKSSLPAKGEYPKGEGVDCNAGFNPAVLKTEL